MKTIDTRSVSMDIAGQDVITSDKVTLRLNAVVSWRVIDPSAALSKVDDYRQWLYRDAQLALRAVIGARTLDDLLCESSRFCKRSPTSRT